MTQAPRLLVSILTLFLDHPVVRAEPASNPLDGAGQARFTSRTR